MGTKGRVGGREDRRKNGGRVKVKKNKNSQKTAVKIGLGLRGRDAEKANGDAA